MSRLSELAETMRSESEQQAEHTRQMLHSVMQQHRQAIENDLNALRSAIGNSIRANSEAASKALQDHMTARPKRIARLWWIISALGILAAALTWGLSVWQGKRALEYLRQAESAKAHGAVIVNCTARNAISTVKCVKVKTAMQWDGEKKGTAYMEISR